MTIEIIELRVHHAFACLPHYTGERGKAEHGEGFILNFNGKITLLNQGAAIRLVDTWDSVCMACLGKQGRCYNQRMQEVDRFALGLVNEYLTSLGYKALNINNVFQPGFEIFRLLREGYKNGLLREICVNPVHGWNCNCAPGCIETAGNNFVSALFQKSESSRLKNGPDRHLVNGRQPRDGILAFPALNRY